MIVILFGGPGAGKGTQSALIQERYGIPGISTGELIRSDARRPGASGEMVKQYTDRGLLVPDEIVVAMLRERLAAPDCKKGYILDGFPRTLVQANALDEMGVVPDAVISIEAGDDVILARLAGRRVCSRCGEGYHIRSIPPKKEGVCDKCGGALVQRGDDSEETIRERLRVYHQQTKPVRAFYRERGLLHSVDGGGSIDETAAEVSAILRKIAK